MQCSIKRRIIQLGQVRLQVWVVLSLLVLAMVGRVPDSQGGWLTCPLQADDSPRFGRWTIVHREPG